MTFPIWHWHIENSSICSLRCPRCPRNEVPSSLVQTSLDLEFFERNFTEELLKNVWQISFCGDDGDPIYGKDFLDIVKYLKTNKPNLSLRIITNGSYKKDWWWHNLATALNQYDEIHFSIDGWDQTSNEKYRVNSDWDSITTAVKTVRANSTVIMTWAAIAFRFNEDHLDEMNQLASELGFDRYQITKSTKFGAVYDHYYRDGDDILEPYDPRLIAKGGRFERIITDISKRKQLENGKSSINDVLWTNIDRDQAIIPMCQIGNKGLYISADGYFYPCCWMANRYNHTRWQQFRNDAFDLKKRTIEQVLEDQSWIEFFDTLHDNSECVNKCSAKNYTKDYATQW